MAFGRSKKKKEYKHNSQTNTYAILSLIFGILFFIPFSPILAIIFGFLALGQIKHTKEPGRGLAMIGIILGFFWLLIILILLLFVVLALTTTLFTIMPIMIPQ